MVEVSLLLDKVYVIDNVEENPRTLFVKLLTDGNVAHMLRLKEGASPINLKEVHPVKANINKITEVIPIRYYDNHPELKWKVKQSSNYGNYVFKSDYDDIFSK